MDQRWKPISRDSQREVKIILHPTAAIYEVRRGLDLGSDDSIDLSAYVSQATQTAFDCNVVFKFNRELFGANQPKPNQVLEVQLKQNSVWQAVWIGHVDAINQYTLQRGERSLQLIAKTREQQDIWKNTKRMTPLFPQMTNFVYMAQRIARSAGMQYDEVALPPSALTTAHSNTQMADMNAWDMLTQIFIPLGWTPFIDNLGRLRAADRSLQARQADAELTDDRIVKVTGSRQRSPVSRVRVLWLNPTLKMYKQIARNLKTETITVGWFLPVMWKHVDFSDDKTQRATDTYFKANPSVNRWIPFVKETWTQQEPTGGRLFFDNWKNFTAIAGAIGVWVAAHNAPDTFVHIHEVAAVGGGYTGPPEPKTVQPTGRRIEAVAMGAWWLLMMNMGTGSYEIWGNPYDWVHARNTSEAFDSSVPTWVDNAVDIECDFIVNEEHAKVTAIRELIYQARASNKWSVTIVDDPRIEYGDILKFADGTQIYVEDFSRSLERGSEATLNISGFVVGPVKSAAGGIMGDVPNVPGEPGSGGGGEGGGGGETPPGEPTIPDYSGIVSSVEASFNTTIPVALEEEGKAQLTREVGWRIYQIDANIGLYKKTYGVQVMNLSTDLVVQKTDGSYSDVATAKNNGDGTVTIRGTWQPHAGAPDLSKWVQPTAALASAGGPMTPKV